MKVLIAKQENYKVEKPYVEEIFFQKVRVNGCLCRFVVRILCGNVWPATNGISNVKGANSVSIREGSPVYVSAGGHTDISIAFLAFRDTAA